VLISVPKIHFFGVLWIFLSICFQQIDSLRSLALLQKAEDGQLAVMALLDYGKK